MTFDIFGVILLLVQGDGEMYSIGDIKKDLNALGVKDGDSLLIHSSFKSLGEMENGAVTFFDALISTVGQEGNIIFPTFSYRPVNDTLFFDVNETPVCVGYLPNEFRGREGVKRSLHPTHSCAVWGRDRDYLIGLHELDVTPVGENSPITKLPLLKGKILMVGCGMKSMTSMHGVEETVGDMFLADAPSTYTISSYDGSRFEMKVRRHAFAVKGYAQDYEKLLNVLDEDCYVTGKVGDALCYLINAERLWQVGKATMLADPYYFTKKANQD